MHRISVNRPFSVGAMGGAGPGKGSAASLSSRA